MNRRNFLNILGGGTILAAAGSAGFLFSRTPTKALEPWAGATTYTDPIKRALAHALLAPNPHNRQPWLVDLSQESQVTIHRDTTRDLPMTDPLNRQIFIGMGCFLETLRIAALSNYVSIITDQQRVEALRQITWDALEIEMLTPHTLKESVDLMRIGKR